MLENYIKIAWRNILKNRFYTSINIIGLTVGLAVGLLILLWVQDELSFDRFHSQAQRIYRVETVGGLGQSRRIFTEDMAPIATFAKRELPEVANTVRLSSNYLSSTFKYGSKVFRDDRSYFADPSFFKIFDFAVIKGDMANPFPDHTSVVISKRTALKYFGDEDPIGKIISDDKAKFHVTAVTENAPNNSSIQYDMLFPMSYLELTAYAQTPVNYGEPTLVSSMDADWHNLGYETYFLMKDDIKPDIAKIQTQLRNIHIRNRSVDTDVAYLLQPISKMHLYRSDGGDGGIATVRIFAIVSALILIIACINYVNLSTALSMLRAREVSMRKIIGAAKMQLFAQFMIETVVMFAIAMILAVILIVMMIPAYNDIAGKELTFTLKDPQVWLVILSALIVTLAASSIYPALLLSSFDPLKALKGRVAGGMGSVTFRKVLVTLQFSVSIVLIIGTIIIGKQLSFIRNKNLGYDKEQVMTMFMGRVGQHYDAFKSELLKDPAILSVTRSSGSIVDIGDFSGDNSWEGMPANVNLYFHPVSVDRSFVPFFKMKMVAGNNFTGSSADSTHFVLNETAIAQMGIKDPIGKSFRLRLVKGTIIGVVADFHITNMHKKIEPVVLRYDPQEAGRIYIKTAPGKAQRAIAIAEHIWKKFDKETPFYSGFIDDTFNYLYKTEQRTGTLFNLFSGVAIMISCLGLLGLSTYSAQIKIKEIGIRKVLGASTIRITGMLSQELLSLVFIAMLIAMPIAWYGMDKWLQDFAYRTQLQWWIFPLAGIAVMAVALFTISFRSVKAAVVNPVKSLRSE